jgi:hypothetical protein
VNVTTRYLVYADDGAALVYSGTDADEYVAHCRNLGATHAGSLWGTRAVGRSQQWHVRAFFLAPPPPDFVEQRRHFYRFRLDWEPAPGALPDAAGS